MAWPAMIVNASAGSGEGFDRGVYCLTESRNGGVS